MAQPLWIHPSAKKGMDIAVAKALTLSLSTLLRSRYWSAISNAGHAPFRLLFVYALPSLCFVPITPDEVEAAQPADEKPIQSDLLACVATQFLSRRSMR